MSNTTMAQKAYGVSSPGGSAVHNERDIEYHAFAYVTGTMATARDSMDDGPMAATRLGEAMYENLRLWTTLAADAADQANRLPAQTRAQIVSLANFARAHMRRVMNGEDSVEPLIEVNLAVMKGLRGDSGEESGVA